MSLPDDRPCGSHADHVPHPWDFGRRWCKGRGRYAQPTGVPDATVPCGRTWTGPTGVIWDCTLTQHPSDPGVGYCGSGHNMVARHRLSV